MPHTLKTLMLGASLLAATSVGAEVTDAEIEASYHEKAVLTQLLRWYQYYENTDIGIANQLDILDEGFSVTSPSGTATGHAEYETAVSQFPDSWQNAHDLQSMTVTVNDDGTLGLTAEIIHSNLGMTESLVAHRMGYKATLAYSDGESLPKFTDMVITPVGPAAVDTFADTYVINRLMSLVSYWIHLVESSARDAEPFREILAPTLDIKFSDQGETIISYEGIAAWVADPVSSLPATRHVIGPVTYAELEPGRYEVNVGFDWQGIRPDGKRMTAKTAHTWIVTDDPTERFARVERIRVETVEPFAVVE